jgi:hypothetical protein
MQAALTLLDNERFKPKISPEVFPEHLVRFVAPQSGTAVPKLTP